MFNVASIENQYGRSRDIMWFPSAVATPGLKCSVIPGTRELYIDPEGTTAGLILAIRLRPTDQPQFVRPGDVLRFPEGIITFWVQNAGASLLWSLYDKTGDTDAPSNLHPSGAVRILTSPILNTFVTPADRKPTNPGALAECYTIYQRTDNTWANRASGLPVVANVPFWVDFPYVGLRAVKVTFLAYSGVGGKGILQPSELPADFSATVQLCALGPLGFNVAGLLALSTNPRSSLIGVRDPSAGNDAVEVQEEVPLAFSPDVQAIERQVLNGSIGLRARVTAVAGTNVTQVGLVLQGY